MTDPDHPDEHDEAERPDAPRTEGVRILGADEAAEAADRPDVVRRRRRGQKRFGDRPDEPEDHGDLPRIRISTSDVPVEDTGDAGRFGAVPVVRPGEPVDVVRPDQQEPLWADDEGFAARPDPDAARHYGHARLVDDVVDQPDEGVSLVDDDAGAPADVVDVVDVDDAIEVDDVIEVDLAEPGVGETEVIEAAVVEPGFAGSVSDEAGFGERDVVDAGDAAPEDPSPAAPSWADSEDAGDDDWDAGPEGTWLEDAGPVAGDAAEVTPAGGWPDTADTEFRAVWDQEAGDDRSPFDEETRAVSDRPEDDEPFRPAGTDAPFEDFDEEESFVLPHWTEPPTGQVPKVVAAEEPEEGLATYGSQPRWRDEGDRTVETDFDDLVDDAPRLGVLGPEEEFPDHDAPDFFDSEVDRDPLEAFGPEDEFDEAPVRTRRRAPASRPRGGGRGPDRPERQGGGGGGGGGDRNLPIAVLVGVVLVGVGLLCFSLGGFATTLLACVVVGAASFEYFGAVQRRGYQPATLLGLVAIVGLLLATYFSALAAYPVVLTLTVVLGLLWYLWVTPGEHSVQNLGITLLGIVWIGLLGSFATLFLGLGRIAQAGNDALDSNPGIGVLIAAVIAAVSHDVGAYFVGRYMGRTPLSAASPNKTQEGLIGGVLTSLVVTMIVVGFVGIAPIGPDKAQTFVFALLCALVAPLGDLCESFIKRDLELKDMGSILPGHGGVLDRFDALLFVLPTAYFVTVLFDVWGGLGA